MKGYPLVLVDWEDSAQPISSWQWLEEGEFSKAIKCRSVGWLVHDGDDVKSLAPNVGDMDNEDSRQVSGVIRIPARCITKIKVLKD